MFLEIFTVLIRFLVLFFGGFYKYRREDKNLLFLFDELNELLQNLEYYKDEKYTIVLVLELNREYGLDEREDQEKGFRELFPAITMLFKDPEFNDINSGSRFEFEMNRVFMRLTHLRIRPSTILERKDKETFLKRFKNNIM